MLDVLLVAVGLLGVLIAGLSARIRRLPFSEPMLAVALGIVAGPQVLDVLALRSLTEEHASVHEGARVLLAVSVMGVALRYPFGAVRRQLRPVALLLLVAMPVMALVSAGLAVWLLGATVGVAILLGTAISPTDPVLASSVVTGRPAEENVPERTRQVLSIESGANDGLALPLVLLAVAAAGPLTAGEAAAEATWQVVGAVILGVALGWLGGRALRFGETHGSMSHGPMLLFTVLLALLVVGLSGVLHLDGVLAVFVAGLAVNVTSTGSERAAELEIDEAVNRFAVLPMFLIVGATIPWSSWYDLGWHGVALVGAVLLLRRLPVLLALRRPLGLSWADAAFAGWFGPIGVSAVFYLTLVADRVDMPDMVLAAGTAVVVASTVAHGVTSAPGRVLRRRLADRSG